jgi:hypothetical protein
MTPAARISEPQPIGAIDAPARRHARHQTLMRAYQNRYVVLPAQRPGRSLLEHLDARYDPAEVARLEALRPALETELILPAVAAAKEAAANVPFDTYVETLLPQLRASGENAFTAFLRGNPARDHHYRNFLLQSSADLLAEASASALGVVGAFGAPQSALFRILIDEFGYGAHGQKHSVLYQAVMRDFGLDDEYDAYAPLFDTVAIELHNVIHYLFQNPRNIFLQVGFLLFAETAYQRSTLDHFRFLREWRPDVDARYFGEHAHIDLHHTRMVIDDVARPLIATYGDEVGREIIVGAELTRAAFARAGAHMLAVSEAFAAAAIAGRAVYREPRMAMLGAGLTPCGAARTMAEDAMIQVGGLGLASSAAFAGFPPGAYGRVVNEELAT